MFSKKKVYKRTNIAFYVALDLHLTHTSMFYSWLWFVIIIMYNNMYNIALF